MDSFSYEVFLKLKERLESFKAYQERQYQIYEGKWTPASLGISVGKELDAKLNTNLDWGKISVDNLVNQLNFDILVGDPDYKILSYFERANADLVFRSCFRNSCISSCAFVSVTKGNEAFGEPPIVYTPYSGYEATGIFNSRTGRLDAGIAIESYNNGAPSAYLIFLPDGIYRVIAEDETVSKLSDSIYGVQLVPFVFDQDIASRPGGNSRINAAQRNIMASAIRTMKRSELAGEFYSTPLRYIFTQDFDSDKDRLDVWNSTIGALLEYNSEDGVKPDIGQLTSSSPEPFIKELYSLGTQFAASAAMDPQDFGVQPSNGGVSAESEAQRSRRMKNLISSCKQSYGESIKQVGIHTMALVEGEVNPELFKMKAAWTDTVVDSDYGKIGDSIGKLFTAAPELRETDFALEKFGISKRSRIYQDASVNKDRYKAEKEFLVQEMENLVNSSFEDEDVLKTDKE